MDDLIAAYQATDYRVRLARGGWASVRINRPLPVDLLPLVDDHDWGLITAWNPQSQLVPRQRNRRAQHRLLRALRSCPGMVAVHAAIGVGSGGSWREPSLFVVGPDIGQLDPVARRFGQNGYLHGRGHGIATLRLPWERLQPRSPPW